jgi:hypothetical protein
MHSSQKMFGQNPPKIPSVINLINVGHRNQSPGFFDSFFVRDILGLREAFFLGLPPKRPFAREVATFRLDVTAPLHAGQ